MLDSRWKFFEVAIEVDYDIILPPVSPGPVGLIDTIITKHPVGKIPAFEGSLTVPGQPTYAVGYPELRADERGVYLRQLQSGNEAVSMRAYGTVRVYNLAILEPYQAPRELPLPEAGGIGDIGFRSVDESVPNLGVSDCAPVGFSTDTKKKILSIHQTGLVFINEYIFLSAAATAINTGTDVMTIQDNTTTLLNPAGRGLDWLTTGTPIQYTPGGVTYPAPLTANTIYYAIRLSPTTMQVATTPENAVNGIAIDLTTTGNLAGFIRKPFSADMQMIKHTVGYPPTYMLARLDDDIPARTMIGPLEDEILARVLATNSTLDFKGYQSVFGGKFGLIILKDPAEIAS